MEDEKYKEKDSEIPFETTPFIFTEYKDSERWEKIKI